jgi:hypothetical protein
MASASITVRKTGRWRSSRRRERSASGPSRIGRTGPTSGRKRARTRLRTSSAYCPPLASVTRCPSPRRTFRNGGGADGGSEAVLDLALRELASPGNRLRRRRSQPGRRSPRETAQDRHCDCRAADSEATVGCRSRLAHGRDGGNVFTGRPDRRAESVPGVLARRGRERRPGVQGGRHPARLPARPQAPLRERQAARDVPITELAAQLEHSKKSPTLDTYSHVLLET